MKLTEELKKQAAEHFKVLKQLQFLFVGPDGRFFTASTPEEAYRKYSKEQVLIVSRKDAAHYLGDGLYH